MDAFSLQPLKVASDGGAEDGLLVLHDDVLVAVLVRLDQPYYGVDQGRWHLELGLGACSTQPRTFATLAAALRWAAERLDQDADAAEELARRYVGDEGDRSNVLRYRFR